MFYFVSVLFLKNDGTFKKMRELCVRSLFCFSVVLICFHFSRCILFCCICRYLFYFVSFILFCLLQFCLYLLLVFCFCKLKNAWELRELCISWFITIAVLKMYMKKLRTPEWLKTSTFSCNTSVKLYTNGTLTLLKFCHLLTFCDVFSCKLFTRNHKISLALRARRARAILFPLKKLLGLINTKYCTRNHVMTYTYSSVWVKSKEGWYQCQWPGFWQSHQQIQMTAPIWLMRVWLSLWLSMSTLVGIDVALDTIIIITL